MLGQLGELARTWWFGVSSPHREGKKEREEGEEEEEVSFEDLRWDRSSQMIMRMDDETESSSSSSVSSVESVTVETDDPVSEPPGLLVDFSHICASVTDDDEQVISESRHTLDHSDMVVDRESGMHSSKKLDRTLDLSDHCSEPVMVDGRRNDQIHASIIDSDLKHDPHQQMDDVKDPSVVRLESSLFEYSRWKPSNEEIKEHLEIMLADLKRISQSVRLEDKEAYQRMIAWLMKMKGIIQSNPDEIDMVTDRRLGIGKSMTNIARDIETLKSRTVSANHPRRSTFARRKRPICTDDDFESPFEEDELELDSSTMNTTSEIIHHHSHSFDESLFPDILRQKHIPSKKSGQLVSPMKALLSRVKDSVVRETGGEEWSEFGEGLVSVNRLLLNLDSRHGRSPVLSYAVLIAMLDQCRDMAVDCAHDSRKESEDNADDDDGEQQSDSAHHSHSAILESLNLVPLEIGDWMDELSRFLNRMHTAKSAMFEEFKFHCNGQWTQRDHSRFEVECRRRAGKLLGLVEQDLRTLLLWQKQQKSRMKRNRRMKNTEKSQSEMKRNRVNKSGFDRINLDESLSSDDSTVLDDFDEVSVHDSLVDRIGTPSVVGTEPLGLNSFLGLSEPMKPSEIIPTINVRRRPGFLDSPPKEDHSVQQQQNQHPKQERSHLDSSLIVEPTVDSVRDVSITEDDFHYFELSSARKRKTLARTRGGRLRMNKDEKASLKSTHDRWSDQIDSVKKEMNQTKRWFTRTTNGQAYSPDDGDIDEEDSNMNSNTTTAMMLFSNEDDSKIRHTESNISANMDLAHAQDIVDKQNQAMQELLNEEKRMRIERETKRKEEEERRNQQKQKQKQREIEIKKAREAAAAAAEKEAMRLNEVKKQQANEARRRIQTREGSLSSLLELYPGQMDSEEKYTHLKSEFKQILESVKRLELADKRGCFMLSAKIGLRARGVAGTQTQVSNCIEGVMELLLSLHMNGDDSHLKEDFIIFKFCMAIVEDTKMDYEKKPSNVWAFATVLYYLLLKNGSKEGKNGRFREIFEMVLCDMMVWFIPYCPVSLLKLHPQSKALGKSAERCTALEYQTLSQASIKAKKGTEDEDKCERFIINGNSNNNNHATMLLFEWENDYFTRIRRMITLYACILSINGSNSSGDCSSHPLGGMDTAWLWLSKAVQLPKYVYPEVCALLSGFLSAAGFDLMQRFPKQLPKMLRYIEEVVIPATDVSSAPRKAEANRLTLIINEFHQNGNRFKYCSHRDLDLDATDTLRGI